MFLLLTHDIDWPRYGPGVDHILARKDRFDDTIISRVLSKGFNPYFGIPTLMEIEDQLDVRSTFFFRPKFDDGRLVNEYEDILYELLDGGWEVGLHVNSPDSLEDIIKEKRQIEAASRQKILGSRIHNLKISENSFRYLKQAGLCYDSSLMYSKDTIDQRNSGFEIIDDLLVFPITFMDTYLFTYHGLNEKNIVEFMMKEIHHFLENDIKLITLLWHDNSIMMRGGRMYPLLLKKLVEKPNIEIVRAVDAFRSIV